MAEHSLILSRTMLPATAVPIVNSFSVNYFRPYPWRVLRVETGRESDADRHLKSREIDAFLPTYTVTKRPLDRHRPFTVQRALFPGYLFASFDFRLSPLAISTPHVFDILRFDRREAVIEPEEMSRIHALTEITNVEPWEKIATGSKVRIVEGPLTGATGRVISRKPPARVAVEIAILGRFISTFVDGWQLELL